MLCEARRLVHADVDSSSFPAHPTDDQSERVLKTRFQELSLHMFL